jgi:glutamyl-tRNA synthetase
MQLIKSRFAPSPTGKMHIGSVRAALLPYMFVRKNNGKFLFRIDDTDIERSKDVYKEDLLYNMKWLNISFDETFAQSSRKSIYDEIFNLLRTNKYVYECFESKDEINDIREIKRLKKQAPIFTEKDRSVFSGESYWRFALRDGKYNSHDLILGDIEFGRDWSDPIILKSDGSYSYIFASVVDDILCEITHVIRGSEHITNAAIQQFLGDCICNLLYKTSWKIQFAHYPLFLNSDGTKMSKRNLDSSLEHLHYLEPLTFWSIMSSLGTSQNQIYSKRYEDYIEYFDLSKCSKAIQKFSFNTLEKTNLKIIRSYDDQDIINMYNYPIDMWNLFKNNIVSFEDLDIYIKKFIHFLKSNSKLKTTLKNLSLENLKEEIKLLASKENKEYKEYILDIYKEIFQMPMGPQIEDLVIYLKNNSQNLI